MHYKNGVEAKVGDLVVGRDWQGNPVAGIVVGTQPGATTCNISVVPMPSTGVPTYNSSEFMRLADAVPPTPAK